MPNELVARNGLIALNNSFVTGSLNVTSGITGSLFGTSSWAIQALTASSADNFSVRGTLTATTLVVQTITSSVNFITGSTRFGNDPTNNTHQFSGSVTITGSLSLNSGVGTINATSSWAARAVTASIADNAVTASRALNANTASFATSAANATTASFATSAASATSASFATSAANATSASIAANAVTASRALNANTASFATSAANATTASFATSAANATSASIAANAVTASRALNANTASFATSAASATSASYATFAATASSANGFTVRETLIANGSVGIGTTSPSDLLHIGNTTNGGNLRVVASSYGNNGLARFFGTDNGEKLQIGALGTNEAFLFTPSGVALSIYTNNAERIRINPSGSVGIGTTSPSAALTVAGDSGVGAPSGSGVFMGVSDNYANIQLNGSNGSFIDFSSTGTDYRGRIIYFNSSDNMQFYTNGGTRMTILSGGSVGIGTTSPAYKLEVNGATGISGQTTVTSDSTEQITIRTATDTNRQLLIGYNYSGNYGAIQAVQQGTAYRNLILNQSGGNVGIGTTAPASLLHVSKAGNSAGGTILMGVANDSTGKWSYLVSTQYNSSTHPQGYALIGGYTSATANTVVIGGSIYEANPATEIQFWTHTAVSHSTGGSQRMTINTNGSVGIGSITPAYTLDVAGTGRFTGGLLVNTGTQTQTIGSDGTYGSTYPMYSFTGISNGSHRIFAGTADDMYFAAATSRGFEFRPNGGTSSALKILSGGSVGIGTTSPASRLQIGSLTSTSTATPETLSLGGTFSNSAGSNVKFRVYEEVGAIGGMSVSSGQTEVNTWSSGKLAFYRGTNLSMIIDASGNVGIGRTSPSYKLDVSGSTRTFGYLLGVDDSANIKYVFTNDGGASYINSGNVGIGTTSPAYKLDVNGSIGLSGFRFADKDGNYNRIFEPAGGVAIYLGNATDPGNYYDNTGHNFRSRGGGTTYVTINNVGNVGIGTTSPTHTLYVDDGSHSRLALRIGAPSVANTAGRWTGIGLSGEEANTKGGILFESLGSSFSRGKIHIAINNAADQTSVSTSDAILTVIPSGEVGINTTSPYDATQFSLDVNGGVIIKNTGKTAQLVLQNADPAGGGNNGFIVHTAGGTTTGAFGALQTYYGASVAAGVLRLQPSTGNVGIGTTSASYKLDVSGEVHFQTAKVKFIGGGNYNENIRMYAQSNDYSSIAMGAVAGDTGTGVGQWTIVRWPSANSYQFTIRYDTTDNMTITTGGTLTMVGDVVAYSDARVKKDILPITGALEKIMKIQGVSYVRTDVEDDTSTKIGFIAQEIKDILPEVVTYNKEKDRYGVSYGNITALLVEAIKEQQKQIDELKYLLQNK